MGNLRLHDASSNAVKIDLFLPRSIDFLINHREARTILIPYEQTEQMSSREFTRDPGRLLFRNSKWKLWNRHLEVVITIANDSTYLHLGPTCPVLLQIGSTAWGLRSSTVQGHPH